MVKDDALTHWLKNHQQQVLLDEDVRRELVAHVTANGYAEDLDDEEIVKSDATRFSLLTLSPTPQADALSLQRLPDQRDSARTGIFPMSATIFMCFTATRSSSCAR